MVHVRHVGRDVALIFKGGTHLTKSLWPCSTWLGYHGYVYTPVLVAEGTHMLQRLAHLFRRRMSAAAAGSGAAAAAVVDLLDVDADVDADSDESAELTGLASSPAAGSKRSRRAVDLDPDPAETVAEWKERYDWVDDSAAAVARFAANRMLACLCCWKKGQPVVQISGATNISSSLSSHADGKKHSAHYARWRASTHGPGAMKQQSIEVGIAKQKQKRQCHLQR